MADLADETTGETENRVFTTGQSPARARRFMTMAALLFSMAGLVSFSVTGMFPIIPVLFTAGLALYFWPSLFPEGDAIVMERRGLSISGLGRILWEAVDRAHIRHFKRGGVSIQLLEITLAASIDVVCVEPDPRTGIMSKFQVKPWRSLGPTKLVIDLSNLNDPPEDIKAALEHFLRERAHGRRGLTV